MAEIKERKYDLLCCITVIDFTEVISSFLTSVEVEKVIWELRFDEKKLGRICVWHISEKLDKSCFETFGIPGSSLKKNLDMYTKGLKWNGLKMLQVRFWLDIMNSLFMKRVVNHWTCFLFPFIPSNQLWSSPPCPLPLFF